MFKKTDKIKIKKYRCFLILSYFCTVIFAGCTGFSSDESGTTPTMAVQNEQDETKDNPLEEKKKGYLFLYNDIEMAMDMEAAPVLTALGKEQSYFEADSCVIKETIRTYSYGSFELDTYELEGKEYISCIYFKDDTIATAEGAYLFMPKTQLFELYGESYTEEAGMLVYSKEGMKLKFILKDDVVTSIQYTSLVTEVKQ